MEADEHVKETPELPVETEKEEEEIVQDDDKDFEDAMVAKSEGLNVDEEAPQDVTPDDEVDDTDPEANGDNENLKDEESLQSKPEIGCRNEEKLSEEESEHQEQTKEAVSTDEKERDNEDEEEPEEPDTQRVEEMHTEEEDECHEQTQETDNENEALVEGEEEMEVEESDNADESQDPDNPVNESAESGVMTRKRTLSQSSVDEGPKRKVGRSIGGQQGESGSKHDKYCWVCHKEGVQVNCKLCPRSYHSKCMSLDYPNAKVGEGDSTCPCPECVVVMNAETLEFRSDAMKQLTLDQLMGHLKNICLRMREAPGSEPFVHPVDPNEAEDYFDYIIYPMDIETLEKNIKKRLYGSTEGFLADAQWLVHNSIVFNSASSQYTLAAKRLLKVCKQELTEIETCPECYTNAHEKPDTWFVEACKRPHLLVWARLKGFPFWPAKAMKIKDNNVDVRFFGQHDRAWVLMKDCFLYSEEMPVAPPKKNGPLLGAIEELTAHVEKLKETHGEVIFAPVKTPIGSSLSTEQIRKQLPEYRPPELAKESHSTNSASKSSGSSSSNNNNNNNDKVPPPTKKSPMTIRISSLKTNPTIVNISALSADSSNTTSSPQTEARVQTRLTRKSSAAAAQSNQNQSVHGSESDQSNDEQKEVTQDNKDGDQPTSQAPSVPDVKSETDEEAQPVPKGSEILANALVRRSTRGMSRSGDSNAASSEATPQSLTPTLEKRLTRGAMKSGTPADEGCEADSNGDQASDEQPPDTVLEAMGLSKKTKENPGCNQTSLLIKGEITDHDESEESGIDHMAKPTNNANHLMEQLSSHTSIKPGYRFNLSKDISISAVEGGGDPEEKSGGQYMGLNGKGRRLNVPPGHRIGPQGITVGAGAGGNLRPRAPVAANLVNGQPQQKMFTGQQLRQMVRNARPQHILNPRTGQTVRVAGVNPNRPVSMLAVRTQQQAHLQNLQKTAKDGSLVVDSSLNPVQGPITLPGGTITVTPLSTIANVSAATFEGDGNQSNQQQVTVALKAGSSTSNLGVMSVQQQQGGNPTISSGIAKSVKPIQPSVSGATAQQRRQLMVSIPPSVNMHLQNLTKTMGDLVKSTVEQIALEIVEFCNSTQGKAENTRLQHEVERLQIKLKQDVTDAKHNNDIAMRELRMTMENDKKRALGEMKRQMEQEKQKAIEETKKKQWCANCGREALFYCCWNTSYCGYNCQEEHWPTHMSSCSQGSTNSR